MTELTEYKKTSDTIKKYIESILQMSYNAIFSVKLLVSNSEVNNIDRNLHNTFSLCGKRNSATNWEFFIVEGLINIKNKSITIKQEFNINNLLKIATNSSRENIVCFGLPENNIGFTFEKKKARDIMLWCILTLFYKTHGSYPEIYKVDLIYLDKLAERDHLASLHIVFSIKLEPIPMINKKAKGPAKGDDMSDEDIDINIDESNEDKEKKMKILDALSKSKNMKADYKLMQKKMFAEKQKIYDGLVKCINKKQDDKNKMINYTEQIDEQFEKMQTIFCIY